MVGGVHELHNLGFVHRDLKPENIVLNDTRPIKVALIDFDRSLPRTNKSRSGTRGTPGYEPEGGRFEDGSIEWDIYSLVAIIVECDMETEAYQRVAEERAGQSIIKKHCEAKGTSKELADMATSVLMSKTGFFMSGLDEVAEIIKKITFKKYK